MSLLERLLDRGKQPVPSLRQLRAMSEPERRSALGQPARRARELPAPACHRAGCGCVPAVPALRVPFSAGTDERATGTQRASVPGPDEVARARPLARGHREPLPVPAGRATLAR